MSASYLSWTIRQVLLLSVSKHSKNVVDLKTDTLLLPKITCRKIGPSQLVLNRRTISTKFTKLCHGKLLKTVIILFVTHPIFFTIFLKKNPDMSSFGRIFPL